MMQRPILVAIARAAILTFGLTALPLQGQLPDYPLAPLKPAGDLVAPYFDGWYENPDGTFTLSFGFMNRNTEETVDVPLGENNYIEPSEFDGLQPTHFPSVYYFGFSGRRERAHSRFECPLILETGMWFGHSHMRVKATPSPDESPLRRMN